MRSRVIVLVCDGLRPDRIDPARTPALWRLRETGVWFPQARSVFPSETRVAAASLVTGCTPGAHGLLANDLYDATIYPHRAVATADAADLAELARIRGRLLAQRTLAEHLAVAGRRYAVVSTASAGTSAILAAGADPSTSLVWSAHAGIGGPATLVREIDQRFGAPPPQTIPRDRAIAHAATLLVEHVLPRFDPDLAVFWSGEPDSSYHARGLLSAEAAVAEHAADNALARILDWRSAMGEEDRTHVIVLSDHGHITGRRRVDVTAELRMAGWPVASGSPASNSLVVVPGAATMIHGVAAGSRAEHELIGWLEAQDWVGAVFARCGRPGDATIAELGLAHMRQPDLIATLRHEPGDDADGIGAGCVFDADLPIGAGLHGGLHRLEMGVVLMLHGPGQRNGSRVPAPCGLIDIAPTILDLLGLPVDPRMQGRVLAEARSEGPMVGALDIRHDMLRPVASASTHTLLRSHVGATPYLDGFAG